MTDAFLYDQRDYERDQLISEYETAKMSGGDADGPAKRLLDEFGYDVYEGHRENRRHFADPSEVSQVSQVERARATVEDAKGDIDHPARYGGPAVDPWLTSGDATERPPLPPINTPAEETAEATAESDDDKK
jgi:hypothetical protein